VTTTQIAIVLAVIAIASAAAIIAGAAVIWGLGVALLTGGGLCLSGVVVAVLYDPAKR
jgi:hypothetical protein